MGILEIDSNKDPSIAAYLTLPVIVKLFQLVLGIICLGIACHDLLSNFQDLLDHTVLVASDHSTHGFSNFIHKLRYGYPLTDQLTCRIVFLVVMGILLLISFIQFTWFAKSLVAGRMKSKIISGVIYHSVGFGLHFVATRFLMIKIDKLDDHFINAYWMRIVMIIAFVNAALYLLSALLALCSLITTRANYHENIVSCEESSQPFSKLSGK